MAAACAAQPYREKLAFVLIDGVGDVTVPALGFRTPLEVANIPTLDAIAGEAASSFCLPLFKPVCVAFEHTVLLTAPLSMTLMSPTCHPNHH